MKSRRENIISKNRVMDLNMLQQLRKEKQKEKKESLKKFGDGMFDSDTCPQLTFKLFSIVCLIYTLLITTYNLTFLNNTDKNIGQELDTLIIELIIDIYMMIELLIHFKYPFIDKNGFKIPIRKKSILLYLKSFFILDLIAGFPTSIAEVVLQYYSNNNINTTIIHIFAVIRLKRFLKIFEIVSHNGIFSRFSYIRKQIRHKLTNNTLIIIKFLIVIFISSHIISCSHIIIARESINNLLKSWISEVSMKSNITIQITSLYWTVQTLTTVGQGDIKNANIYESIFRIITMLFGAASQSYMIGNLTYIINNKNNSQKNLNDAINNLDQFANSFKLSENVYHKIQNQIKQKQNQKDAQNFAKDFPEEVKEQFNSYIFDPISDKIEFLQNKPIKFKEIFITSLNSIHKISSEIIYTKGDVSKQIYFILQGSVNCYVSSQHQKTLNEGQYFGDFEILNNIPRIDTIISVKNTQLLIINKQDFKSLIDKFNSYRDEVQYHSNKSYVEFKNFKGNEKGQKLDNKIKTTELFDITKILDKNINKLINNAKTYICSEIQMNNQKEHGVDFKKIKQKIKNTTNIIIKFINSFKIIHKHLLIKSKDELFQLNSIKKCLDENKKNKLRRFSLPIQPQFKNNNWQGKINKKRSRKSLTDMDTEKDILGDQIKTTKKYSLNIPEKDGSIIIKKDLQEVHKNNQNELLQFNQNIY